MFSIKYGQRFIITQNQQLKLWKGEKNCRLSQILQAVLSDSSLNEK